MVFSSMSDIKLTQHFFSTLKNRFIYYMNFTVFQVKFYGFVIYNSYVKRLFIFNGLTIKKYIICNTNINP